MSSHILCYSHYNLKNLQVEEKYTKIVMGMGDHSRLALCAFMIGLIAFNPFSAFFGSFMSDSSTPDFTTRVDQRRILVSNDDSKELYNYSKIAYCTIDLEISSCIIS